MIDGRRIVQLETDSLALKLALLVVAALAFLIGWRFRFTSQGLLLGSLATIAIIAVDTFVFWKWRIILPIVLALLAWFLGEFTGRYIGRWLGPRESRSIQVVCEMTRTFHSFVLLFSLLLLGGRPLQTASAQGQIYVIESTTAAVKVGTAFALDDRITVPAGASIRVVMPSGKTQTIKGPYSDAVADLAQGPEGQRRGHGLDQDPHADGRLEREHAGRDAQRAGAGAARRASPGPPYRSRSTARSASRNAPSWSCDGARRQRAERFIVVDMKTEQRGEVEFAPGSETAPWPAGVAPRPDGDYALLAPENRPRRQVTLRVLDAFPARTTSWRSWPPASASISSTPGCERRWPPASARRRNCHPGSRAATIRVSRSRAGSPSDCPGSRISALRGRSGMTGGAYSAALSAFGEGLRSSASSAASRALAAL